MNAHTIQGLTSIIIPCWNQWEFTQHCIAALKQHTRPSWELVVVDNGSSDETKSYLAGVRDLSSVPVTIVSNTVNVGFPAAINQGLRLARGEYLVLLNNDVVVTDGWLDQLIALVNAERGDVNGSAGTSLPPPVGIVPGSAESTPPSPPSTRGGKVLVPPRVDPSRPGVEEGEPCATLSSLPTADCVLPTAKPIGLAGPMSNYASPPQLVENVFYRDISEMHQFAKRWRSEHLRLWFTVPKLSAFCLLIKRAVFDTIGGLDERFGLGFFDDDDLAERARRAGFELAVAHDLFVHHFGSRTFAGNGIDAERLLDQNARRFAEKWGRLGTNGQRVSLRPFPEFRPPNGDSQAANGHTRASKHSAADIVVSPPVPESERARVSLTMIVKNEEHNLARCLESVRRIFDEIVVVDTGSTDGTIEIARSFGANVFEFAWVDSFAAARNEALSRATGEYAFWLDADDVVEADERERLRAILATIRSGDLAGYVVRCACDPSPDGTGGDTVVDHIRLFPLRANIRWTYRVHEQILPGLHRAHVPVRWTDLTVRHTGYVDRELRGRKLERDARLLRLDLEDHPGDPFINFNLGTIAIERGQWDEALKFLERSLADSAPTDSIVRKLFALIARAQQMKGDSLAALHTCARGLQLDPDDAELWFRKAVVHRHRGESAEAERSWRRILGLRRPHQFCSVDQGIYGHLTRRNLAVLASERGDHPEARRLWEAVLGECPGDREALAQLLRGPVTIAARPEGVVNS